MLLRDEISQQFETEILLWFFQANKRYIMRSNVFIGDALNQYVTPKGVLITIVYFAPFGGLPICRSYGTRKLYKINFVVLK